MIDAAVCSNFEILGGASRWCLGVRTIECVSHAHPIDGLLRDAVKCFGRFNPSDVEEGRHDVNDMVELVAGTTDVLDVIRPGNCESLSGSAKV